MKWNRVLSDITTGDLIVGTDYWMIPYDVAQEIFTGEEFSLSILEELGAFIATNNKGEKCYFISKTAQPTLPEDLWEFLLEFDAIGDFNYIYSSQNVGG